MLSIVTSLETRLVALESDATRMREENAATRTEVARALRRMRVTTGLAFAVVVASIIVSPTSRAALAQSANNLAARVAALESAVASLNNKTQYVSVTSGEMYVTGTNLHIVNGLGTTGGDPSNPRRANDPIVNGKGNLIIGYNESRTLVGDVDHRTGSHNLVMGIAADYTSISGIVSGYTGSITAPMACVISGQNNTASSIQAVTIAGSYNDADAPASFVAGGNENYTGGGGSAIVGGQQNYTHVHGNTGTVIGGRFNNAEAPWGCVTGGSGNTASNLYSSVSGGANNIASGEYSSVSGGVGINNSDTFGWSGGFLHSP